MAEYKLMSEIIYLCESSNWNSAVQEWELSEIYFATDPDTCLCGHYPIKELCILSNRYNGNEATVGNCCVKRFLNLPSDTIFNAVKRVQSDNERSLNKETIEHAYNKKWINDWEHNFYLDIMNKRILSDKRLAKKIQVNEKILLKMKK